MLKFIKKTNYIVIFIVIKKNKIGNIKENVFLSKYTTYKFCICGLES